MHDESQVQNNRWKDVTPVVDSGGGFRYSCVCGKEIGSKSTFKRHINKCKLYQGKALELDYHIRCKICDKGFAWLKPHLRQSHNLTTDEYFNRFPNSELNSEYHKKMSSERSKINGNWIEREKSKGNDLSEYRKKMGKSVSEAILSKPEERKRRAALLSSLWKDKEFAKKTRKISSETAKKTSARKDIQEQRAARLKKWRDKNPEEFYEKCTSKAFSCSKRKTRPEKDFHKFANEHLGWLNIRYSQSLKSIKFSNKSKRRQIDFMSKDRGVWIEIDGPLHFKEDFYKYNEISEKDNTVNEIASDKKLILIRISFDQWCQKTGVINKKCLQKVKEILEKNVPGVFFLGKEYGNRNIL